MLATLPCDSNQAWQKCNGNSYRWRVGGGMHQPPCGDMGQCSDNTDVDTLKIDDMISCVPGKCFAVDFEIDLGGETEASRTLIGNVPNAAAEGWETGVFFMYDPTVSAVGSGDDDAGKNQASAPLVAATTVAAGAVAAMAAAMW